MNENEKYSKRLPKAEPLKLSGDEDDGKEMSREAPLGEGYTRVKRAQQMSMPVPRQQAETLAGTFNPTIQTLKEFSDKFENDKDEDDE